MSNFLFKAEFKNDLEVDFEGSSVELAAALLLAAKRNPEIRQAVNMAAAEIREEHRDKECHIVCLN